MSDGPPGGCTYSRAPPELSSSQVSVSNRPLEIKQLNIGLNFAMITLIPKEEKAREMKKI